MHGRMFNWAETMEQKQYLCCGCYHPYCDDDSNAVVRAMDCGMDFKAHAHARRVGQSVCVQSIGLCSETGARRRMACGRGEEDAKSANLEESAASEHRLFLSTLLQNNLLVQQLVDPASRSKGGSADQAGAYAGLRVYVCVVNLLCIARRILIMHNLWVS